MAAFLSAPAILPRLAAAQASNFRDKPRTSATSLDLARRASTSPMSCAMLAAPLLEEDL
jgi:hypothetical protein